MKPAIDADLLAGFAFVTDVNPARRVVADQDGGQPWPKAMGLGKVRRPRRSLRLHSLRQLLAIEQSSGHTRLPLSRFNSNSATRAVCSGRTLLEPFVVIF